LIIAQCKHESKHHLVCTIMGLYKNNDDKKTDKPTIKYGGWSLAMIEIYENNIHQQSFSRQMW
jgi:hypothetical protein